MISKTFQFILVVSCLVTTRSWSNELLFYTLSESAKLEAATSAEASPSGGGNTQKGETFMDSTVAFGFEAISTGGPTAGVQLKVTSFTLDVVRGGEEILAISVTEESGSLIRIQGAEKEFPAGVGMLGRSVNVSGGGGGEGDLPTVVVDQNLIQSLETMGLPHIFGNTALSIVKVGEEEGGLERRISLSLLPEPIDLHFELKDDTWIAKKELDEKFSTSSGGGSYTKAVTGVLSVEVSNQDDDPVINNFRFGQWRAEGGLESVVISKAGSNEITTSEGVSSLKLSGSWSHPKGN